ncbi:MAG: NAD(P)-dependent oxidoreductase [Prevotella sp.]|nr:NAD(P)-dependent oxidoreductase [Prevotella sp.]
MNILLTGATGFIGKNLLPALEQAGHNVYVLVRHSSDYSKLGATHIVEFVGDIRHIALYLQQEKIDGIIHLASLYLTVHTPEQVKDLVSSNVYFGTAVLEAASFAGCVKWFLNTGSIWQNYNTKGTEYNPVNLYAATKQAFIDMAKYYSDVFGIKFCTLKLCDTYGPNDTRKKLFKLFKDYSESGEVLKMSPGEQKIDLIYITDIIAGFTHLADLLASGTELADEYVLTSGQQIPLKELAQMFCDVTGRKLNIEWGGRPYRDREVMIPWKGTPVPGWKAQVSVIEGIKKFIGGGKRLLIFGLPASVRYSEAA